MKYKDEVFMTADGVKVTIYAPRQVRSNERTFDPARSKYSQWVQGVSAMRRGVRGVYGTVG